MKLSICFYPNQERANKKTGKIPIYLRVMLNRQKAEQRLNLEVTAAEMQTWDDRIMRFTDREMKANVALSKIETSFNDFCYHHATSIAEYNAKTVRDKIMGLEVKPLPTIIKYLDSYFSKILVPNEAISEGTKRNYKKAINHMRTFLAGTNQKQLTIQSLNSTLALSFKDYLLTANSETGKIALKEPSALDIVKKMRTIFDRAVDEELLKMNPFKKIKLKSKSARRGRLDIIQVANIYKLNLTDFPIQQLYRDLFLFSVFTGLSYSDSNCLQHSDLTQLENGDTYLYIKRNKTQIITEMVLPKQAALIIEKYKNGIPTLSTRVLPGRSNKEINVQLKILANMANIPIKLTTHLARHTFRQLLAEADIVEMPVIKRMMGHSRSNDIDDIYYSVTRNRLQQAKNNFEAYLNKFLV